jgi:class 3 adenylate cyclase
VKHPETSYARVGAEHVAYQVIGHGPRDIVVLPGWFSSVEAIWDLQPAARFLERIASFGRLILFDRRGFGLSDPAPDDGATYVERSVDDLIAVLDAAGSTAAVLVGCDGAGPVAIAATATYASRVSALVLVNTFARMARADDYPAGIPTRLLDTWLSQSRAQWEGEPGFAINAPSVEHDAELRTQFTRFLRLSVSPGVGQATRRVLHAIDVRDALCCVQAPTLVVHRVDDRMIGIDHGRYLAQHIQGARLVELPGSDHLFYIGDVDAIVGEIEEFLTGARHVDPDRVLATVMFTDIVASTARVAAVGDRQWRGLVDEHDRVAGTLVERFQGELVKTMGDGVLATFDGPGRAVRCAAALRDAMLGLGLETRAGLHSGEVERRAGDLAGLAVVIARRICDRAGAGEIFVSRTVTDLVVGSRLEFAPCGVHVLKGLEREWPLFALTAT